MTGIVVAVVVTVDVGVEWVGAVTVGLDVEPVVPAVTDGSPGLGKIGL